MSFSRFLVSSIVLHGLLLGALILSVEKMPRVSVSIPANTPMWATFFSHPVPGLPQTSRVDKASVASGPPIPLAVHPSAQQLVSAAFHLAKNMQEGRVGGASFHTRKRVLGDGRATGEDALYLDSWKRKIEFVGGMNYPAEARRLGLSGRLSVRVLINQDGSIREATLLGSSGKPILDQAALRIVHLAGPFSPLPPTMRKRVDVLEIVRTWHFLGTRELVM